MVLYEVMLKMTGNRSNHMRPAFQRQELTEATRTRGTEHSTREMRGFYCFVLWIFPIFSPTIATQKRVFCYEVPQNCQKNPENNVPSCIEAGMRNCSSISSRIIQKKNYFSTSISSEKTVDTERGYVIHISKEALQKSSNKWEKKKDTEVKLIVSLLSDTLFRVSSSLDKKTGNGTNSSSPILHGQNVVGVWLGEKEVHNLSQPVQLRFLNNANQSENGKCVYWHLDKNGKGS
ncbi:uncharacterized protein [Garra rufa]|uniref:uncharacterized protein n=1 Tax=Garra rufa TaxID=137080 RepID=UPI003CCEB09E